MYFGTFTLTTVGYGDLVPSSRASRLFTMGFALLGVCVIAVCLKQIMDGAARARASVVLAAKRRVIAAGARRQEQSMREDSATAMTLFDAAKARGQTKGQAKGVRAQLERLSSLVTFKSGSFDEGAGRPDRPAWGPTVPPTCGESDRSASSEKGGTNRPKGVAGRLLGLFPVLAVGLKLTAYLALMGALFAHIEEISLVDGVRACHKRQACHSPVG